MKKLLVARARLQIGIICVQKHNNKLPNNRAKADKSEGGRGLGSTVSYCTVVTDILQLVCSYFTVIPQFGWGPGQACRGAGACLGG